jgi:hypothetical protein
MDHNESLAHASPLPPLRIHHFLTWMTVTAITIAAVRASIGRDYFLALSNDTPSFLLQFLSDLIASLATTVCGFVLYWRFRTVNFVWERGHGFLLQQAATLVLRMVGSTLFALFMGEVVLTGVGTSALSVAPSFVQWFFLWQAQFYVLLDVVIFLFSACFVAPRGAWRALYLLLAGFAVLDLAWSGLLHFLLPSLSLSGLERAEMVSNVLGYLPKLVAVICLVALSWREKRLGISRHWSHWCGVGCFLASALLAIGSGLWFDFFSNGWTSYPPTSTTP